MSMVEWVFDNRRVSLTIVVLLSLVGVQGYINLPKQENPDFTIRNATIITQLPGANAQRMEELVSSVLEQKIVEMPELDNVSSTSRNGMSIVVANYKESYTNMRPIFDDLRRKVDDAAQDLPAGVIGPVVDDEFDVFGSVYTLSGEGYSFPELKDKAEDIRDLLLGIDEVAKVEFQGIRDETIYVEYSDAKLRELGFTANELANAIRDTNIISSGGRMLVGNERISLEPTGDFSGIEALRTTVLRNAAGDLFQIQDLAQGSRVLADPPSELVFASGEAAVSINISMREGGDILVLGERLDELFADVEARLPIGMEIRKTAFQADFVELTVNNFVSSILQAVLIVGIVLLLFLGPRTGVIIAASIPVTIAITLAAMNWLGMAIDQVSLSGLIIALGLLVDNSIVIAESIQLRLQRGEGRLAAAAAVAGEMRIPLMIGSATTIAAFLPIALAESAVGEFCASIFYIVAIALTVSWGLSMTVVPLLGGLMLPAGQASGGEEGTWMRSYRALVSGAVKMRFVTILVAAALFYSMTIAMGMVANVFIPPSDEPLFTVELDMPQGVDISVPERIALDMNEWFASDEAVSAGITNWTQYVGISAPAFKLGYSPGQSDAAHMTALVNVSDGSALDGAIAATAATIAANYPDAQYKVDRLSQGPPVSYPVQIRLSGPEVAGLEKLSAELASELRGIEGVLEIINDWGVRSRKI
ncbi:MAG: efflux RND transporter permease subunit, partial [Granulosicoccaceae bacterium]